MQRQIEQRDRAQDPHHRRCARHVVLHVVHAARRFDRDAARVEGDALADDTHGRAIPGAAPRRMLEHDESRRVDAALTDAEQRTHLSLAQFGNGEHAARESHFVRHLARLGRERRGRHHVGGLVGEPARDVLALRERHAERRRVARRRAARPRARRGSDTRVSAGGASSFRVARRRSDSDASSVASASARTASLRFARASTPAPRSRASARVAHAAAATARPANWRNDSTSSFSSSPRPSQQHAARRAATRVRRAPASRPCGRGSRRSSRRRGSARRARDPPLRRVRKVARCSRASSARLPADPLLRDSVPVLRP